MFATGGLARRAMGGPWAGPGTGAKFWKSTGSGRARAGKFEKLFLSHEFYCGKLPTIFSTSAPSYQAPISKQHKQGGPWAGPGLGAKFWKSTGSGRARAGKFEKLFLSHEFYCGKLPTIFSTSAPLSRKHHQTYKSKLFMLL